MGFRLKTRLLVFLLCVIGIGVFFSSPLDFFELSRTSRQSLRCGCAKCLTDDHPCIMELLNGYPKPFLSKGEKVLEEDFNWWRRIQGSKHNYTFLNESLEAAFKIFPPTPPSMAARPDRCRRCAVVGNSGNLKGSHYGRLIDFHDLVIRMNRGPTKGYEEDVGTKTTHHVMYPESARTLSNNTYMLFFPYKTQDFLWLHKKFDPVNYNDNKKRIANKNLVMILNPGFMKYVHREWLDLKGAYGSTGFMTFVVSLYMCDEVNVFGFGADRDGNWNHYFEKLRNKNLKTGGHPGKYEYNLIQNLHKKKLIQFFRGW